MRIVYFIPNNFIEVIWIKIIVYIASYYIYSFFTIDTPNLDIFEKDIVIIQYWGT